MEVIEELTRKLKVLSMVNIYIYTVECPRLQPLPLLLDTYKACGLLKVHTRHIHFAKFHTILNKISNSYIHRIKISSLLIILLWFSIWFNPTALYIAQHREKINDLLDRIYACSLTQQHTMCDIHH